jgi:tRNA(Arg) A34 adenosine deaminase TadA
MIKAGKEKNLPTAALLLNQKGEIITQSQSLVASYKDPTAHADLLVISQACKQLKQVTIQDLILVSVFEPSLMTLCAANWAAIKSVYYILPASKYWDRVLWTTESKQINKDEILKSFEYKMEFMQLPQYFDEFDKVFMKYVTNLIPRKI